MTLFRRFLGSAVAAALVVSAPSARVAASERGPLRALEGVPLSVPAPPSSVQEATISEREAPPAPPSRAVSSVSRSPGPTPSSLPSALERDLRAPRVKVLQRVGTGLIVASTLGYVGFVAMLLLGQRRSEQLYPLTSRDEIDERRRILARGDRANSAAIGLGLSALATMIAGIVLVARARRVQSEDRGDVSRGRRGSFAEALVRQAGR